MTKQTEKVADASIILWEQLAIQIISIVGEDGFNALYVRSVFLSRSTFPGSAIPLPPQAEHRFAELKGALKDNRLRKPAKQIACC